MTRTPLPQRRRHSVVKLEHGGTDYNVGYGLDAEGVVREVFADTKRWGTDLHALLSDACILISLLAQNGYTFAQIAASLHENKPEGIERGVPASIIGAIAREGALVEEENRRA